jgi:putative nucleotidyltransferase with HDIG domain
MDVMDREQTMEFLRRHVKTDMLMKHLLSVEAAMRGYARKFGEDEDRWGVAGLLHDFDWEICPTPESHPEFGAQILREHGYPEDIIRAVLTHGDHTGIPRQTLMEHALYAVDELSGFIRAVALVRPSKSLDDVTPSSVRRKMKDKGFAKDVNREDITRGAAELGVDLDEHITFVVESLKPVAGQIDLSGRTPGPAGTAR